MELPDVNILVDAFRADSQKHAESKRWLESVLNGDAAYGMSLQVLSSVVRVVTHPRIFKQPSPIMEVLAFCEVLLAQPNCKIVQPGNRHWAIFVRLCTEANAVANLTPDAWFAALAIEHGCEWVTGDSGYAMFAGLKWRRM